MIACIHQPNFLPWLGFFAKIAASDVYVAMDSVQFPRNSWVNRVRIGGNAPPMWLTVPIRHLGQLGITIRDVEISWETDWWQKALQTLRQRYARSPWRDEALGAIDTVIAQRHTRLADQNLALIETILAMCGIERKIVRASELHAEGAGSALIVAMCRAIGTTQYLAGQGASEYEDLGAYTEAGIEYRVSEFKHPQYPQRGRETFEPGLSILDALLSAGPDATREMLLTSSSRP